jgi:ribose transport system permease protein
MIGMVGMFVMQPSALSGTFVLTLLQTSIPLLAVALGQTAVVISGGLDLSVAGVMSLTSAVAASQMTHNSGIIIWLPIMFAMGALAGFINGMLIALGRIPAFIVTLATWSILDGIALEVLPTEGGSIAAGLTRVLSGNAATLLVVLALMVVWVGLRSTRFGITIYALGSRESAARQGGLRVRVAKVGVYVFSGLTAVAAGVFYSAVVTVSGSPTAGDAFLLQSFAAVVVGGTVLSGGRGGFYGTVVGALVLSVVSQIIVFANIQSYYSVLAYGALLVIMVSVYSLPEIMGRLRARAI